MAGGRGQTTWLLLIKQFIWRQYFWSFLKVIRRCGTSSAAHANRALPMAARGRPIFWSPLRGRVADFIAAWRCLEGKASSKRAHTQTVVASGSVRALLDLAHDLAGLQWCWIESVFLDHGGFDARARDPRAIKTCQILLKTRGRAHRCAISMTDMGSSRITQRTA